MSENNGGYCYEVLMVETGVLVHVPKWETETDVPFMKHIKAHTFLTSSGEKVSLSDHYAYGMPLRNGDVKVILNKHFYGFSFSDLGKKAVATVKVVKKTLPDGKEFIMIDITKETGAWAKSELKLKKDEKKGVQILGTNHWICFKPTKQGQVTEFVTGCFGQATA